MTKERNNNFINKMWERKVEKVIYLNIANIAAVGNKKVQLN